MNKRWTLLWFMDLSDKQNYSSKILLHTLVWNFNLCYLGFFLKWTKNKGDEYTWNRKWQWASNHFYDYFAALPHLITKVTKEDNGYHFKKILLWQRASQWMIFVFKSLPFSLICAWKKLVLTSKSFQMWKWGRIWPWQFSHFEGFLVGAFLLKHKTAWRNKKSFKLYKMEFSINEITIDQTNSGPENGCKTLIKLGLRIFFYVVLQFPLKNENCQNVQKLFGHKFLDK